VSDTYTLSNVPEGTVIYSHAGGRVFEKTSGPFWSSDGIWDDYTVDEIPLPAYILKLGTDFNPIGVINETGEDD
jgi:hypothetical protein